MRRLFGFILPVSICLPLACFAGEGNQYALIEYTAGATDKLQPTNPTAIVMRAVYDLQQDRCRITNYLASKRIPVTGKLITPNASYQLNLRDNTAVELSDNPTARICRRAQPTQGETREVLGHPCTVKINHGIEQCFWKGIALDTLVQLGSFSTRVTASKLEIVEQAPESSFSLPEEARLVSLQEELGRAMSELAGTVQAAQKSDPKFLDKVRAQFDKLAQPANQGGE